MGCVFLCFGVLCFYWQWWSCLGVGDLPDLVKDSHEITPSQGQAVILAASAGAGTAFAQGTFGSSWGHGLWRI